MGKEDKTGTSIMFYIPSKDRVVINKDMKAFDDYVKITQGYLMLDDEQRKDCKKTLSEIEFRTENSRTSISEFLDILDYVIFSRKMKKLEFILSQQFCPMAKIKEFKYLLENSNFNDVSCNMANIFNYGYMEGIRAERARRNAGKKSVAEAV